MSQIIVNTVSNFFKVIDMPAFKLWCEAYDITIIEGVVGGEYAELVAITEESGNGWPTITDACEEIDFPAELAKFIDEDYIAVLSSAGCDNKMGVWGEAVSVNNTGIIKQISLDSIYADTQTAVPAKICTRL